MDFRVIGFFIAFIILISGFCFGGILLNVGNNIFYILLNISTLVPLGAFIFLYLGDSFPDRKMSVAIGSFMLFFLIPVVSASVLTNGDNQKISVEKTEMIKKYIAQQITTNDEKVYLDNLFSHSFSYSDDPYVAQRVGGLVCIKSINSSLCKLWLDAVVRDVKSNTAAINEKTYGDVEAKKKQRETEQQELKKFEQENLK